MYIQPRDVPVGFGTKAQVPEIPLCDSNLTSSNAVTLCLDGMTAMEADLCDVTPTGFRIRYSGPPLPLGLEMVVVYSWGKVNALVASVVQGKLGVEVDLLITG